MTHKVTIELIESKIKGESYLVLPDGRTTLCILNMENGYTIKGLSACVDASNFDLQIGRKFAREDAVRQIWPLEGYLLAQRLHDSSLDKIAETTKGLWGASQVEKSVVKRVLRKRSAA